MKTMNHQAPARPQRHGAPAADREASAPEQPPRAGAQQSPFPLQAIPWAVSGFGLLLVLTIGLIWATVL